MSTCSVQLTLLVLALSFPLMVLSSSVARGETCPSPRVGRWNETMDLRAGGGAHSASPGRIQVSRSTSGGVIARREASSVPVEEPLYDWQEIPAVEPEPLYDWQEIPAVELPRLYDWQEIPILEPELYDLEELSRSP